MRFSTTPIAPFVTVLAEEHDRAPEVGVVERGARDEELTAKRAHRGIVARPAARADDNACETGATRGRGC